MSEIYTISDCKLIQLNEIGSDLGNLTYIEGQNHIPFPIRRVYYIYDVPPDAQRAGHAHKNLFQLLIAVAGSFDIHLDDGLAQRRVTLNRPEQGLIITPMIWRTLDNFSSGAVCLALASDVYDASSYYRDYKQFLAAAGTLKKTAVKQPIN